MAIPQFTFEEFCTAFWAKVGPPDDNGCRPWLRWRNGRGYGMVKVHGRDRPAHGVAWRLTYQGPTKPEAEIFRHSCDHPWCAEPAHVYPGTQRENLADMIAKGRSRGARGDSNGSRTHPERRSRGRDRWNVKLSEDQVREIRATSATQATIAARYGISPSAVSMIKGRKTWAWLD